VVGNEVLGLAVEGVVVVGSAVVGSFVVGDSVVGSFVVGSSVCLFVGSEEGGLIGESVRGDIGVDVGVGEGELVVGI